jgi:UDP-N-acetylglucosamine 2-epimerase
MILRAAPHASAGAGRPAQTRARVVWLAGTRGELLSLGPLFLECQRRALPGGPLHWFMVTGEQGMAAQQALDGIGLQPDEIAPLCHPADEPTVRLHSMLERVETFARRRKATHFLFSGFGPTAVASALACHARGDAGLWLRPADPAGVIGRLALESGYARVIEACAPRVTGLGLPAPDAMESPTAGRAAERWVPEEEIEGLRADAPAALISLQRREWGIQQSVTKSLARAAAGWATAHPELDWLVLSNLNAALEGPLRALDPRPANLLIAPPLPYPLWRALLGQARWVLTDSPRMAAEALAAGVATAVLGDLPPTAAGGAAARQWMPEDLIGDAAVELELGREANPVPVRRAEATTNDGVSHAIEAWLGRA